MSGRRHLLPYALMLVVPSVVLAGFGFRSIEAEDRARRQDVRARADAEARRVVEEEADALDAIRAREERRPYFQYQAKYMPEDAIGLNGAAFVDSPLLGPPEDPRVRGWFQWTYSLGVVAGPDVFGPDADELRKAVEKGLGPSVREVLEAAPRAPDVATAPVQRLTVQAVAANEEAGQLLEEVAVSNVQNRTTHYLENFRARVQQAAGPDGTTTPEVERIDVRVTPFRYRVGPPGGGGVVAAPFVAAWRLVWVPGAAAANQRGAPRDRWLLQGYLLDGARLFPGLETRATPDVHLRRPTGAVGRAAFEGASLASLLDRVDLGAARASLPADRWDRLAGWPFLHVAAFPDLGALDAERSSALARFWALLAGLACVVGVGFFVLARSVRTEVELAQRKQDFVAAVTHELKTPLAGILMYADMLKEGWVPEDGTVEDYAGRIGAETKRLSSLVDQVLDLAALERGTATVRALPGDLAEPVRAAAALVAPAAEAAGVPVRVDVAPGLPSVRFDAALARSLFVNLIDNAVKYSASSPTKDVSVAVRRAGDGVEVVVADRGPGIPKDEQARLFRPFSRGGREETRTARGVGLGLALVQRYADAHRAKVSLDSEPGRGTTVAVRFPGAG